MRPTAGGRGRRLEKAPSLARTPTQLIRALSRPTAFELKRDHNDDPVPRSFFVSENSAPNYSPALLVSWYAYFVRV